jgi:TusA-related sulfurtransferase
MENKVKKSVDLHGVACPMNFVKTKAVLATLEKDDLLEVILDEGDAMLNVPRSVKEEGHQIIKVVNLGTTFSVIIRKG